MPNQQKLIAIPDIMDKSRRGQKLCDVLSVLLTARGQAHIASGYFNLDGYRLIKDTVHFCNVVFIPFKGKNMNSFMETIIYV